jgi:hypothetical protein
MNLKLSLAALLGATALTAQAAEPSKLFFGIDAGYNCVLSTRAYGETFSRSDVKFNGVNYRVKALYQLAPQWAVGGGIGVNTLYNEGDHTVSLPIFAAVEFHPFATDLSHGGFYAYGNIGYSPAFGKDSYKLDFSDKDLFDADDLLDLSEFGSAKASVTSYDVYAGMTGEVGVGYRKMFTPRFGVNLQLGYSAQQLRLATIDVSIKSDEGTMSIKETEKSWFHGLAVTVGVTF